MALKCKKKEIYDIRNKTLLHHHWLEEKIVFFLNIATVYLIQKVFTDHSLLKDYTYSNSLPDLNDLKTNMTFSKSLKLEIL